MTKQDLFPRFSGFWVPLCAARDIPSARPLPLVLAGTRIVLFRSPDGTARALLDQCPHRGVALSLGTLAGGELACPFHGWRFDGAGRCTHVPWNPDAKRENLSATALPLRETGGLIWLHTGREAPDEPRVPDVLQRPDVRLSGQSFIWKVHWTRVMENMLDTPHLPFVHARTIGKGLRGRSTERMDMFWRETDFGAQITATRPGESPRENLRYWFPNTMELTIDPGTRVLRMLAVCSPAMEGETRLSVYTIRNFAKSPLLDPLFARLNARIAREDQAIVESSLPSEVPAPASERSVATDAPTLAFRKLWFSRILHEGD